MSRAAAIAYAREGPMSRSTTCRWSKQTWPKSWHSPMGRLGQPAELASIDVQLAASDASDATGPVYGASGGAGLP